MARQIQQGLYPKAAPTLAGCEIDGAAFPANATGGDYFDYFTLQDGSAGIVVGDASGHGVGPALLSAATRSYLRALALTHSDVGTILSRANNVLSGDISEGHFVTVFLARLDPCSRVLTYASAAIRRATSSMRRERSRRACGARVIHWAWTPAPPSPPLRRCRWSPATWCCC